VPHSLQVTERTLYVFAKEPRPGTVKTRLCPPLSSDQAAACHRAFFADTLATQVRAQGVRVVVAATPDRDCPWLRETAARFSVDCIGQGEGHLGERMQRVLHRGCRNGGSAVVIGSDTPDLTADRVGEAFAVLQTASAVVGPSLDGGYYLIGCRAAVPPIFELECAWGGSQVMAETRVHLRRWHGDFVELDPWTDIDTFEELQALFQAASRDPHAAERLPSTSALLTRWCEYGTLAPD